MPASNTPQRTDDSSILRIEFYWLGMLFYGWLAGWSAFTVTQKITNYPFGTMNLIRSGEITNFLITTFMLLVAPLIAVSCYKFSNKLRTWSFLLLSAGLFIIDSFQFTSSGIRWSLYDVPFILLQIAIYWYAGFAASVKVYFGLILYASVFAGILGAKKWSLQNLKTVLAWAVLGILLMISGCAQLGTQDIHP